MNKVYCFYVLILELTLFGCGKSNDTTTTAPATDECGLTAGQSGIKICSFVATPTASESVTLKNYDSTTADLRRLLDYFIQPEPDLA